MRVKTTLIISLLCSLMVLGLGSPAGADLCASLRKELAKAEQEIWKYDSLYTTYQNSYRKNYTGPNSLIARDQAQINKVKKEIETYKKLYPNDQNAWGNSFKTLRYWENNLRVHNASRVQLANDIKAAQQQQKQARIRWVQIADEAGKHCRDPQTQRMLKRNYRNHKN